MVVSIPEPASGEPSSPVDASADVPLFELDWLDSDGEAYVAFNLDEEWPEHFGSATAGVP